MKTIIHSFLCCCLLASVAHCVELKGKPELKKRWAHCKDINMLKKRFWFGYKTCWIINLKLTVSPTLSLQTKHMAGGQNERGSWKCSSREESRVLHQTRGYQGYIAATFQVRQNKTWSTGIMVKTWMISYIDMISSWMDGSINDLFLCPPALASTSEPRGQTPEGRAACWAPVRITTWHTACTSSAPRGRPVTPQLTRWNPLDTAGGVDLSQSDTSHWGWRRAGWDPCGAQKPHRFTSWRLSSEGHERESENGSRKQKRGKVALPERVSSVLLFLNSKRCLKPQTLAKHTPAHLFQAWGLSQSWTGCSGVSLQADPCSAATQRLHSTAAGSKTLDGTVWRELQVL